MFRRRRTQSRCIQKTPGIYLLSLLSGYKPNRISWLELSSNSDWESNASNTCKMGTFSRLVMLKIVTVQGSDPPSEQRGCSNLAAMAAYRFREVTQHVTLLPLAGLGDRE